MGQRAKWNLPITPEPDKSICFQIQVPDDPFYVAAFLGALYELSKPYAWQNDPGHTALVAGKVWSNVFDTIRRNNCPPTFPNGQAGADGGDELMIRQNPDNPCELQNSVDGVTWCTWADLSKCIPAPAQPGAGTSQPSPGETVCYHAAMAASSQYLVPVPVNSGDVITLSNATGATNDPDHFPLDWVCPGGQIFVAGFCTINEAAVGTDPVPASPHMKLVIGFGATFYDFVSPFTVPSGIVNIQPVIQVNDSNISNDNGTLTYDVCVKNNTDTGWEHVFDLLVTDASPFLALVVGTWVPGSGWHAAAGGGNLGLEFGITTPSTVFTDVIAEVQGVTSHDTSGSSGIDHNPGSGYVSDLIQAVVDGVQTYQVHGTFTSISWLFIWTACLACSSGSDVICSKITFRGKGTNPF